ncbi:HAD family hydrolase [Clostridium sp. BJN0013]|uniref:HAD family hydrolase n=1 Tax=Clostridium sp. BJN0013 TaxID=3236840 RepID=UPI0034C6D40D
MEYECILFDLDGTLTDSAIGITNSVIYALKKYDIKVDNRNELNKFVGPPLSDSFESYYGFSKEEAKTAVEYYREYYREKGMFENLVYDGIEDLLKTLKYNNKTLVVATSKPQVFAQQILEKFDIAKYFAYIAGSNLDGTRVKKDEVIQYALESCNITNLPKVIMIGDREHDINGAKKVGIDSIGVLYGYGDRDELEKAGADFIVNTVLDIKKMLI